MTIWFTSDEHHEHENLLYKYQPNRRALWNNLGEMTEGIIARHNEVVKDEDEVFHLGDFSFARPERTAEIFKRLNGKHYLVQGNHDKPATNPQHCGKLWTWIKDYYEFEVKCEKTGKNKRFICSHFPFLTWHWMGRGSLSVHGHQHGKKLQADPQYRRFDIGLDANDCYPVPAQTLIDLGENTNFKPKSDEY